MSTWQVKLPRFEGPMDLLLFLVSRQEYDILDLPMAEITESYLGAIDQIGVENLEDAGDFLLMAATLLSIKAKMMLPRPKTEEQVEIEDPRRELAERLMLYQRTKEAAAVLGEREDDMLQRWEMGHAAVPETALPTAEELLMPMTLYDLTRAIEDILNRKEHRVFHQVKLHKVSMEERMRWVYQMLEQFEKFGLLSQLSTVNERMVWVVTFLALLELGKRQQLHLEQTEPFSELFVSRAVVPEPELEAA